MRDLTTEVLTPPQGLPEIGGDVGGNWSDGCDGVT